MSTLTHQDWLNLQQTLTFEGRAWINGSYCDAQDQQTLPCINPANKQTLTEIADCSENDVNRAVSGARDAFNRGEWARISPSQRRVVLEKLADLMAQHAEELALLESLDMGKTAADALAFDIPEAIRCFRFYAGAIETINDEVLPTAENVLATVTREPLGVVAAVVPWNFPLMITSWKIAPALATGNSVIVKPAEQSSLSAIRLAALAAEAGLPNGVLQVVPGQGKVAGQTLGLHNDVDCLTFTGSTLTGKRFMTYSAQSNLKRVWLECGGKSPQIIFDDYDNLERAAATAAAAIFINQGEVCIAASRLYVQDSIYDRFLPLLLAEAKKYQPGNPLNPESLAGAIVDQLQFDRIIAGVEEAITGGAKELTPALRSELQEGWFLNPTILECSDNSNLVMQEELFGPVLGLCRFTTEAEVIALANDSDYGLGAGLWTNNLGRAHRVSRKLQAGMIWVNSYADGAITVPFGGRKQSGFGRDKSIHALEKYTDLKSTWIDLNE